MGLEIEEAAESDGENSGKMREELYLPRRVNRQREKEREREREQLDIRLPLSSLNSLHSPVLSLYRLAVGRSCWCYAAVAHRTSDATKRERSIW